MNNRKAHGAGGARMSDERRDQILNNLTARVNELYGVLGDWPRINRGPCGPFAKLFRTWWVQHRSEELAVVFVMGAGTDQCWHVLVRLPGGKYYDGGFGVMSERELRARFDAAGPIDIEIMEAYDESLLEARSHGFDREYRFCPTFSWEQTDALINEHLAPLSLAP